MSTADCCLLATLCCRDRSKEPWVEKTRILEDLAGFTLVVLEGRAECRRCVMLGIVCSLLLCDVMPFPRGTTA